MGNKPLATWFIPLYVSIDGAARDTGFSHCSFEAVEAGHSSEHRWRFFYVPARFRNVLPLIENILRL